MEWYERYIYSRPEEEVLYLTREVVEDTKCPECGGEDIRQYPLSNHLGPRIATKCQDCMHILEIRKPTAKEPWPPFRSVTYDWEASDCERASSGGLK
jgi:rubredoxin